MIRNLKPLQVRTECHFWEESFGAFQAQKWEDLRHRQRESLGMAA